VTASFPARFPKGTTIQDIRRQKDKFRRYLVRDTPNDATIAQRCGSSNQEIRFLLEWWRPESNPSLPPEIAKSKENPRRFRTLRELRQRNINSTQATQLASEYENALLESNAEQVNVTIRY
jgi:hypothetical protein